MALTGRRISYLLVAGLLVLAVVVSVANVQAAPLTGGNTTYVIEGEERTFTFDPINRKDGQLLPVEVIRSLGLTLVENGKQVTVARGSTQIVLTLGKSDARINGELFTLTPAALRLNGRLFVPSMVLDELGFDVLTDSAYLQINDVGFALGLDDSMDYAAWAALRDARTLNGMVRSDDARAFVTAQFTYLTTELVASHHFESSFKERIRLLNLMKQHAIVLVRVANDTGRSVTLNPASLMLVDGSTMTQYDMTQNLSYSGNIKEKIAHGAAKSSLVVYPAPPETLTRITLFADTNSDNIGTFTIR